MCSCWSARVSGRNWDERASVIGRGGAKAFETAGKAFDIPKDLVVKAWQRVRSNNGAPGVDGAAIENFERDLQANLYKIWNRMSLGCRAGRSGSRLLRGKQLPEGGGRTLHISPTGDELLDDETEGDALDEGRQLLGTQTVGDRPRPLPVATQAGETAVDVTVALLNQDTRLRIASQLPQAW